ncbi:MAG TPA: hypothetical protein PKJ23_04025 [bacterium]|nr:hypothetical protein [bacterium]
MLDAFKDSIEPSFVPPPDESPDSPGAFIDPIVLKYITDTMSRQVTRQEYCQLRRRAEGPALDLVENSAD